MSDRRPAPLRLSPRAQRDVVHILRYTAEHWGMQQLARYREKLETAFAAIQTNPDAGYRREDLPFTHRLYLVGSHVIVYREEASGELSVVRILHQRMMLSSHL